MKLVQSYMRLVKKLLPSPFAIAVILTFMSALLAIIFTKTPSGHNPIVRVIDHWHTGIWELLKFTMQMMLMLVLGHTIALSKLASNAIDKIVKVCKTNAQAAIFVSLFSLLMGYFNWGLGLVFGAILARKVGEYAKTNGISLNYPLIATCGYISLMVWHGGLSGSAPLTVSDPTHSLVAEIGVIPISGTVFATPNLVSILVTLIVLPLFAWFIAKRDYVPTFPSLIKNKKEISTEEVTGADKLDYSKWIGTSFGLVFIGYSILKIMTSEDVFTYINLDTINFALFGIALLSHQSLNRFTGAAEKAIKGSTGIMIQFPLYAGIMGIMKYSGLLEVFAEFFIQISSTESFPFFAFLSSAFINILVPSGGGQWQVQGPILIEAANALNVSHTKTIMALAYGDQLTNMLQPFWALPLLGITGLKAKEILPYSILFMLVGGLIFTSILYLF